MHSEMVTLNAHSVRLLLIVQFAVLFQQHFSSLQCVSASISIVQFTVLSTYKDSILSIKPYEIQQVAIQQQCYALCASKNKCQILALGENNGIQCLLYNASDAGNPVYQKNYSVFQKVYQDVQDSISAPSYEVEIITHPPLTTFVVSDSSALENASTLPAGHTTTATATSTTESETATLTPEAATAITVTEVTAALTKTTATTTTATTVTTPSAAKLASCLQVNFGRCAACGYPQAHGSSCSYKGRGCPGNYEPHSGSCFLLLTVSGTYEDADKICAATNGGRLAIVRTDYVNSMLGKWMTTVNIATAVFGISMVNGLLTCRDGRVLNDNMYQNWALGQPVIDGSTNALETILNANGTWAIQEKGGSQNIICEYIAPSCSKWYTLNRTEQAVARILPAGYDEDFESYCMDGMTVLQGRGWDWTISFNRSMEEYIIGFGDAATDIWIGLENIYRLVNQDQPALVVNLKTERGVSMLYQYGSFRVIKNGTQYMISTGSLTAYSDNANLKKNCMANLTSIQLTTIDYGAMSSCSRTAGGAWWYSGSDCGTTNLNADINSGVFDWCSENLVYALLLTDN